MNVILQIHLFLYCTGWVATIQKSIADQVQKQMQKINVTPYNEGYNVEYIIYKCSSITSQDKRNFTIQMYKGQTDSNETLLPSWDGLINNFTSSKSICENSLKNISSVTVVNCSSICNSSSDCEIQVISNVIEATSNDPQQDADRVCNPPSKSGCQYIIDVFIDVSKTDIGKNVVRIYHVNCSLLMYNDNSNSSFSQLPKTGKKIIRSAMSNYVYGTASGVSCVGLALTLLIHVFYFKINDNTKPFVCHISSLLVSYVVFFILHVSHETSNDLILVGGFAIQYTFLLSAILWLHVIGFDLWRSLSSTHASNNPELFKKVKFSKFLRIMNNLNYPKSRLEKKYSHQTFSIYF